VRGVELATNTTGGYVQIKDEGGSAPPRSCAPEKGGVLTTHAADGSETARPPR
jgi:hypothetical protein